MVIVFIEFIKVFFVITNELDGISIAIQERIIRNAVQSVLQFQPGISTNSFTRLPIDRGAIHSSDILLSDHQQIYYHPVPAIHLPAAAIPLYKDS